MMTPENTRELAKIYDDMERMVLDTTRDGEWHTLDGLRDTIPDDLVRATYRLSEARIDPAQPDFEGTIRRMYGNILVQRVCASLVRRGVCEIHHDGGQGKVRKKPAVPEGKQADKGRRTGSSKEPAVPTAPPTPKADAAQEPAKCRGGATTTVRPAVGKPQGERKKERPPTADPVVRVLLGRAPRRDVVFGDEEDRLEATCWGNKKWNRRVARVAKAFLNADEEELREVGITTTGNDCPDGERRRVAVLVATTGQGKALLALLGDGWALASGKQPNLKENEKEKLRRSYEKSDKPMIVTMRHAASIGVGADVLIRATGGDAPLDVRGFPPQAQQGQERPVPLLIDFRDDFDNEAAQDTEKRMAAYRRLGWHTAGEEAERVATKGRESNRPGLKRTRK